MSAQTASEAEVSFKIAVSDEHLSVLQQKLALTTLPDELEDAGWGYGVPLADIRRLVSRWKEGYDWRKHEAQLNAELPQFTRDIEVNGHGTLNVHYIHKKSEVVDAIPLLFVHGCESNIVIGIADTIRIFKGLEVSLKSEKFYLCLYKQMQSIRVSMLLR